MISLLSAAIYIFIYCSESVIKMLDNTIDKINDRIDEFYGAVVEKLPYNGPIVVV